MHTGALDWEQEITVQCVLVLLLGALSLILQVDPQHVAHGPVVFVATGILPVTGDLCGAVSVLAMETMLAALHT